MLGVAVVTAVVVVLDVVVDTVVVVVGFVVVTAVVPVVVTVGSSPAQAVKTSTKRHASAIISINAVLLLFITISYENKLRKAP